jgi:cephalosporin-C deacetylase-like acetyl esterase
VENKMTNSYRIVSGIASSQKRKNQRLIKEISNYLLLIVLIFLYTNCKDNQTTQNAEQEPVVQNNMLHYLSGVGAAITDHALSDITSIADWEKVQPQRHQEFIEMMGIQDYAGKEKTDLNVKVTGTIQREGYRIEKLYYESLPGLYVPAHLYIPNNIEKPAAAILYVNGHSPTQNVRYQPYPAKFAELGFVCLIIETIQFGEVKGDHHGCYARGWFNWYSRGYNPGGVELWNAIRGLDLLASRPEVDPEKMGVTGISGGGSQSWYIAAADPRIKAVAPVCGASTLKAQIGQRTVDGHCDCMMPTNTYQADFQDLGALIAPRPLLIGQADRDGLNTIESVRELHSDIKKMYDLHGKPENISLVETPGGHSYHQISREKIHSFFLKHLMGKELSPGEAGDIDTSEESKLSAEELKIYVDGIPEDDRTTTIQDSFVRRAKNPEIKDEKGLSSYRESVKRFLKDKTFGAFPDVAVPFDPRMEFRSLDGGKFGWNIYSFVPEEGWRLKVDFHWRNDTAEKKPLMIVLKNYDEERWGAESFSTEINTDWNIAYFEARGIGETGWDPALQWHVRRAAAWTGRTIASMQVYDVLRCIEFCRTLTQVDPSQIGIAAKDGMTVVASYAALMDGNCQQLVLKNPAATQDVTSRTDGKGEALEMLNCLRVTDVNQLPALISPTKTVFLGEVPASYEWSQQVLEELSNEREQ